MVALFALFASVVLGVITKRTDAQRLRYGVRCFAYFVAALVCLGWLMKLPSGRTLGEALLDPTVLYASFVRELLGSAVVPKFLNGITGHGFLKIMRAPVAARSFAALSRSRSPPPPRMTERARWLAHARISTTSGGACRARSVR